MSVVAAYVVLCVAMILASPQTAPKPGPRENVDTAIGEAIRLLESKDYRTFLLQSSRLIRSRRAVGHRKRWTPGSNIFLARQMGSWPHSSTQGRRLQPTTRRRQPRLTR